MNLLTMLIAAGKDIAAIKDVLGGELKAQTMSPTVFTALVEQGLKVFTSIYKRVHRSLKVELKKLHRINRVYDVKRTYQIGEELRRVSQDDYALGGGVEPVSDPSQVVDAQKMARTQVLGEFKDDPMMDGLEIRRRMLEAANIEKPDKILSGKPAPNPQLAIQAGQLEIQRMVAKAQALSFMSQAIKNLADADATVAAPFNQWMVEQIKGLQNVIEQGSAGANSSDQQPSPDGLAPAPSDQGGAPISAGLAG